MPVYSVEGKLGTGKTKFAVWMAQQALLNGRRVASNVDLRIDALVPSKHATYVRVPDKPTDRDLDAIGHGNPDTYDEERNGVLLLDELGTWLNSRSFQDKSRAGMIEWLIHARKKGWDVFLIVQDANMIDRQVREALIEFQCRCIRLDKIKVPAIGWLLGAFVKRWGYLPRMHVVTARMGYGVNQVVAERWFYKGDDLHACYDTRQVFTSSYEHGAFSVLPDRSRTIFVPGIVKAIRAVRLWVAHAKGTAPLPRPAPRAKPARLALLMRLPLDEREAVYRRWQEKGLLPQA